MRKHRWQLECLNCGHRWSTEKKFTKNRVNMLLKDMRICPKGCLATPNLLEIIIFRRLKKKRRRTKSA